VFDIVLNNGFVIDPKNRIMSKLNIGIKEGLISIITKDRISGKKEYDCSNFVITPGFVDIHIHEDPFDYETKQFEICISECMLKMGVTSALGGNCGIGPKNFTTYLDEVEKQGHPINLGLLSAHGSLRDSVGTFDKYKSVDTLVIDKMCKQLEVELKKGSVGLSLGIRYIPGINKEEMLALSKIVKQYDGIIAAHIRDDCDGVIAALMELIQLGIDTGVKLQISHIGSMAAFGQMEKVYEIIDHYAIKGLDIGIDCYPYNAFCTAIGSTTFDEGFLERYGIDYSALEITEGAHKGKRLSRNTFAEIRKNHPEYLAIAHVMKEDEVDMAFRHPKTVVASDGILNNGNGHPRAAGTFPRFIREYVLNKKIISLYDAVSKMTYLPAKRFGIDKGTLSLGADADITVFNLDKIQDKASFEKPLQGPDGIEYVFIQGKLALEKGSIVNNTLGRALISEKISAGEN
jgi:N-acyl-D-amino-acid deacylase